MAQVQEACVLGGGFNRGTRPVVRIMIYLLHWTLLLLGWVEKRAKLLPRKARKPMRLSVSEKDAYILNLPWEEKYASPCLTMGFNKHVGQ